MVHSVGSHEPRPSDDRVFMLMVMVNVDMVAVEVMVMLMMVVLMVMVVMKVVPPCEHCLLQPPHT